MRQSKSRDSTTARPEHPNAGEVKENDLKNNFVKKIEFLKEDMQENIKKSREKSIYEGNQHIS